MFHIGDNVRFRDDSSNEIWSILNIYTSINKVQVFSKKLNTAKVVDPLSLVPSGLYELKQAIREVLLSDEFLSAFAKAFANTPMPSTIQSVSDLSKGLVKAWTCENGKAKQVYPEPKWTPQIGDWVRIKKPADTQSSACIWVGSMNKYDGQVIHVKEIEEGAVVHEDYGFLFSWLEPTEQPVAKESLTAKPDPGEGYRLLSKDPQEKLLDTDEGLFACGLDGQQWLSVNYSSGEQLPSVYYRRKIDVETLKQSPQLPDGWRWLEVGEVIRSGDKLLDGNSWFNYPASVEAVLWDDASPSIRRNRFSIGEKVVDHFKGRICIVKGPTGSVENPSEYEVEMLDTKRTRYFFPFQLAPYIEETKPIVDVSVEVTGEVKNPLGCPYGWRWLEVGEMICKGDRFFNKDHGWRNYDLSTGQKLSLTGWPSIRRNRFVVGEKVVHVPSEGIFQVVDVTDRVRVVDADGSVSYYWPEVLAPYIEETT